MHDVGRTGHIWLEIIHLVAGSKDLNPTQAGLEAKPLRTEDQWAKPG